MGMRRMLFGDISFIQNMALLMEVGPLERSIGLMGLASGRLLEKNGAILLNMFILKWGMVLRPSFGWTFGVGHVALRMAILNSSI
jgi:hypothetical protein